MIVSAYGLLAHQAPAQIPGVTLDAGDGRWISRYEPLRFIVTWPADHRAERIAVIVGTTDVTALLVDSAGSLQYRPSAIPLPTGHTDVIVYRVTGDSSWAEAGRFTINVHSPGGFERVTIAPSLTVANKGQLAEEQSPLAAGARERFQELTGDFQWKSEFERSGLTLAANASIVGVSFKPDALRFGERHEDAPKYDLADYTIELRDGPAKFDVGQISEGRERHLLSSFGSRGLAVSTAFGSTMDISAAVMNGANIVGWDNPLGLQSTKNRVYSGTVGFEAYPEQPGTARIEGSATSGTIAPESSFNAAGIRDAEKSDGFAFRLLLADPTRRVQIDAGLSRSHFTNPDDPLLFQGAAVVPVAATTRGAHYADISVAILRDLSVGQNLPVTLNGTFRHERVDPLYRTVGAFVQPDRLANTVELNGGVGPIQLNGSDAQSEDNLADIPSVLKTRTKQLNGNLAVGLPALFTDLSSFLPSVSYSFSRTHQYGVNLPINSNVDPTRVPDQVTLTHGASSEWHMGMTRVSYQLGYTNQDNRQPGQENADLASRTNTISVGVTPLPTLSIGSDIAIESSENKLVGSVQRTRRFGGNIGLQFLQGGTINASGGATTTKDDAGTNSQTDSFLDLQTGYAFDLSSGLVIHWSGQVFIRYRLNDLQSRNSVFAASTSSRSWSLDTGITFNIL